jgi:hypothetical protein
MSSFNIPQMRSKHCTKLSFSCESGQTKLFALFLSRPVLFVHEQYQLRCLKRVNVRPSTGIISD